MTTPELPADDELAILRAEAENRSADWMTRIFGNTTDDNE